MAKTIFERDKLGRVTKKVTLAGTVYYTYDASGKKTSVKDTDLDESLYVYDNVGRLTKVQVAAGRTCYFHYDNSGKVLKKLYPSNRIQSYFSYDGAGRLEQLANLDSTGTVVTYYHYTRNENGAITRIKHEGGEFTYLSYDSLDRLLWDIHETPTGTSWKNYYSYDAASNRLQKSNELTGKSLYYAYDARNLVTNEHLVGSVDAGAYFDYDDAQRLIARREGDSKQSAYFSYDQRDNVTQIDFKKAVDPDSTREFVYDALGERVYVKDGTGAFNATYWTWDGPKLIREGKADGTAARRYRHNDTEMDARGSLIEIHSGITTDEYYPAMDQRGSVWALEKDTGAAGVYEYDAFLVRSTDVGEPEITRRNTGMSPVFQALNLDNQQLNLTPGGIYLPGIARMSVPFVPLGAPAGDPEKGPGPESRPKRPLSEAEKAWLLAWWLANGGLVMPAQQGPGGKGPDSNAAIRCGPDITEWLMTQMQVNAADPRLQRPGRPPFGVDPDDPNGMGETFDLYQRLNYFRRKVRNKGDWDFKQSQTLAVDDCPGSECKNTVTLCGICFFYEVTGNIHYGFVGLAAGIPDRFLHKLAGAAQQGYSGPIGLLFGSVLGAKDEPQDTAQVQLGMDLYNWFVSPSQLDLCGLVRQRESALRLPGNDPSAGCNPCKVIYKDDVIPHGER